MNGRLSALLMSALLLLARDLHAQDTADQCASHAEAGQTARIAGHLRASREHLIACSSEACPRVIRVDCVRWLAEVEREQPTLVVRARDARGQDVSDARVFVDGEAVSSRTDGMPIAVDVGERVLRFERQGVPPVQQTIVVRSGERGRVVSVVLGRPPSPEAKPAPSRLGPLLLGGAGLAVAAGGGVLWAVGRSAHDELESTCAPEGLCATSDIDAAKSKLIVGDVLIGAGVLAVAGAVYWYLASGPAKAAAAGAFIPTLRF